MCLTRETVIERLKEVYDPELGVNVVDLGLIYRMDIKNGHIFIEMTLTTPGCPLHDTIGSHPSQRRASRPALRCSSLPNTAG